MFLNQGDVEVVAPQALQLETGTQVEPVLQVRLLSLELAAAAQELEAQVALALLFLETEQPAVAAALVALVRQELLLFTAPVVVLVVLRLAQRQEQAGLSLANTLTHFLKTHYQEQSMLMAHKTKGREELMFRQTGEILLVAAVVTTM